MPTNTTMLCLLECEKFQKHNWLLNIQSVTENIYVAFYKLQRSIAQWYHVWLAFRCAVARFSSKEQVRITDESQQGRNDRLVLCSLAAALSFKIIWAASADIVEDLNIIQRCFNIFQHSKLFATCDHSDCGSQDNAVATTLQVYSNRRGRRFLNWIYWSVHLIHAVY